MLAERWSVVCFAFHVRESPAESRKLHHWSQRGLRQAPHLGKHEQPWRKDYTLGCEILRENNW